MWNNPFDNSDDDAEGTVFRDVIFLALSGFIVIVLLLLPHINPDAKKTEGDQLLPGNVVVQADWDDKCDTDVDLWVQAPGDVPVGYSNKGGLNFNLLRDDLGIGASDPTDENSEVSYSRGIPEGEYVVNVHLYRNILCNLPLDVKISIGVKKKPTDSISYIISRTVSLNVEGQEITVVRFTLDENHNLVLGSVNDLPKALRGKKDRQ